MEVNWSERSSYSAVAAALLILGISSAMITVLVLMHFRKKRKTGESCALMIVLGSGGHTAEMLTLVRSLDVASHSTNDDKEARKMFPAVMTYPRCYVVAETDALSADKALRVEQEHQETRHSRKKEREYDKSSKISNDNIDSGSTKGEVSVVRIPRSREVGQSYVTSCFTTINAIFAAFPILLEHDPKLLLVNGPGTCLPLCIVARALRVRHILSRALHFLLLSFHLKAYCDSDPDN